MFSIEKWLEAEGAWLALPYKYATRQAADADLLEFERRNPGHKFRVVEP